MSLIYGQDADPEFNFEMPLLQTGMAAICSNGGSQANIHHCFRMEPIHSYFYLSGMLKFFGSQRPEPRLIMFTSAICFQGQGKLILHPDGWQCLAAHNRCEG